MLKTNTDKARARTARPLEPRAPGNGAGTGWWWSQVQGTKGCRAKGLLFLNGGVRIAYSFPRGKHGGSGEGSSCHRMCARATSGVGLKQKII